MLSEDLINFNETIPNDVESEDELDAVSYTSLRLAVSAAITNVQEFELEHGLVKRELKERTEQKREQATIYAKVKSADTEYKLHQSKLEAENRRMSVKEVNDDEIFDNAMNILFKQ